MKDFRFSKYFFYNFPSSFDIVFTFVELLLTVKLSSYKSYIKKSFLDLFKCVFK